MNKKAKDRTMWLTNVQVQLVSNLEETQIWYKDNVDEHRKEQPNFKVKEPSLALTTTYQNNMTIREVELWNSLLQGEVMS
jgi:hypothetical protein